MIALTAMLTLNHAAPWRIPAAIDPATNAIPRIIELADTAVLRHWETATLGMPATHEICGPRIRYGLSVYAIERWVPAGTSPVAGRWHDTGERVHSERFVRIAGWHGDRYRLRLIRWRLTPSQAAKVQAGGLRHYLAPGIPVARTTLAHLAAHEDARVREAAIVALAHVAPVA